MRGTLNALKRGSQTTIAETKVVAEESSKLIAAVTAGLVHTGTRILQILGQGSTNTNLATPNRRSYII
jgi:predicted regulator of Ras-like GTPase activity (Roadblock/LC7/MglB family)